MSSQPVKKKTMANLEAGDCRWPIGDPRHPDFHFCGAPQQLGRPYCAAHWALSFSSGKPSHDHGGPARPFPALSYRRAA